MSLCESILAIVSSKEPACVSHDELDPRKLKSTNREEWGHKVDPLRVLP